jgi:hypothetical protein
MSFTCGMIVPSRSPEHELTVIARYPIATLVHQRMVEATQEQQIVEIGWSTVRPVRDVMTVDEAGVRAAREPTAPIAALERPANGWRDRAGLATHRERLAVRGLEHRHDRGIAAQAPRGLG